MLTPGDVLGNAPAFFLRKPGHDGNKQFTLAVKCENSFLLKVTFHAVFFQLSDGYQAVHGISGKTTD